MCKVRLLVTFSLSLLVVAVCGVAAQPQQQHQQLQLKTPPVTERVRTDIPYRDGTVVLISDFQEGVEQTKYRATGHVEITYQDMTITCDEVVYDEETQRGVATGHIRFSQGQQWLSCSKAEFDFSNQTGTFYEASGYTDRQFLIRGRTIRKTGPDIYAIQDGFITSCSEPHPKWSFRTSSATVRVDRTARLHQVLFKVKGVPIFYTPYLVVPMFKKERSSGIIPFHTGSSTSKGRLFSEGWYQTLGPSMDLTLYADYFSLRGLAPGGIFRARGETTKLYVLAYGIHDKLGQSGAHLIVEGETRLKEDFRAVSRVNITSSFSFRQAFADTFRAATVSQEDATVFLTRNHESYSTNIDVQRQEVLFPVHSLITRKIPSIEFNTLGQPLGNLPLIFYLNSSAEGVSRVDSILETPRIMQRLDFFPRLALRIPSFAGFSILPSIGYRETYYSAHTDGQPTPKIINQGLDRHYTQLVLDLRTPTLEREFHSSRLGSLKHVIEPEITYRRIQGIGTEVQDIIRFDAEDAVADTNEVEYGIVNRFYRRRDKGDNTFHEILSLSLRQKYYFDPTFGGAFIPGQPNIFYPLDTLTAFSQSSIPRNLSPLNVMVTIAPLTGLSQDIAADYDQKFHNLRDVSVSNYWHQGSVILAGTYFKTLALEPGQIVRDHIQGQVGYGDPLHGFSASLTVSYNIQTRELLNSHSRLNYMWDCCGLSLEFQQYALGLRTETRFSFSFTLKGIGSFGNIKRPESLF